MVRVVLSPQAEKDMLDLMSYLAEYSESGADSFTTQAKATFQNLAEYPLVGRARYELVPGMRSLYSNGYFYFYFPPAGDNDVVLIARVARPERDIRALLESSG